MAFSIVILQSCNLLKEIRTPQELSLPGKQIGSHNIFSHLKKMSKKQQHEGVLIQLTVKILKFGTPQTIAIIVLKIENFDVTLH